MLSTVPHTKGLLYLEYHKGGEGRKKSSRAFICTQNSVLISKGGIKDEEGIRTLDEYIED